jgi:predicted Zn-dependent protease
MTVRERSVGFAIVVALTAGGCVVNPATGKRELSLVSESQEIAIGKQNDEAIVAEMGLYADEELQRYVSDIGQAMAAKSERPDLPWTFRVVDDPVVNAFALPGGFIYMTRGILAHFNNEAELASVLGHEIGHVTARHSAQQLTKAQLAQVGLLGGLILAPERAQQFGGLAQQAMQVLFLKFSRDDERQADDLGLRYLINDGYDPRPMPDVFETLRRVGEAAGGERLPGWLSTHPAPENRALRIAQQIDTLGVDVTGRSTDRDEYLRMIEGVTFGEDPRHGYFRGALFVHPEMAFRLEFPSGWKTSNMRQAVVAVSPNQDAAIQLTLSGAESADAALRAFLAGQSVQGAGSWRPEVRGLSSAGTAFAAATQQGSLRGLAAFVEHGGRVFELLGYSVGERFSAYDTEIARALSSFGSVTDRALLDVEPRRLEIVRVPSTMTAEELARRFDATVPPEQLLLLNGMDAGATFQAGRSYKVVRGGPRP